MASGGERVNVETWYRAIKTRSAKVTGIGAGAIAMATALTQWGNWIAFAAAVGVVVAMVPLNIMFDRWIAPRLGSRGEVYRALANNLAGIPLFDIMGWPLAVWFWLPFAAITLDTGTSRDGMRAMLVICLAQAGGAIARGVPPGIPMLFTVLALVCWVIMNQRTQYIRDLADTAAERRDELARAHTELATAHEELIREIAARQRAEEDLAEGEKFEAIGRLAAGVAHEINTPMQFVSDNLEFICDATGELLALAQKCASPDDKAAADLGYLSDNVPEALAHAQQGMTRVAQIVRSMKELAHPGTAECASMDLNHVITNALVISTYQYKLVADVETDLAADLPVLEANAGELNQVFLNLIVNAAHAIEDVHQRTQRRGRIQIATRAVEEAIEVHIADTGAGIPVAVRPHIFEPFFTTKAVGRGTGQGLAIARAVIERHGGSLSFVSECDVGTTFRIRLPLTAAAQRPAPSALAAA